MHLTVITVEVLELWTVFHEHCLLLGQSSNMGRCISTVNKFVGNSFLNTYPKEFF